jgi:2-methylcitrate dehydratase
MRVVAMKSLLEGLSDYALSIEFSDLPPQVVHEAKRRLVDTLGCALGAFDCPPARIARELARPVRGTYCATILGEPRRTSPELAAFANGVLSRYLDYNDTYLSREPAHPSDNIPAAISVAEAEKRGGKDLLTAIVLAYEVQTRLCDAATLRARGWDHVAYVSISSALLGARLMGLDRPGTANAISLSLTPNTPLRQTRVGELSMWKGCAAANAARNGVFAALLAREGMTGPAGVFEGEMGFFNQVTGPFELDFDTFGGGKNPFKILDTYIKHYPSEYHSQACIEACLELRKEVDVADIEEITIETYDACVDIIAGDETKWEPSTRETADHSLPYCAAVALTDGCVGVGQFSGERISDPALKELIKKVKVKRNAGHTAQYPGALPCLVGILLKDGKRKTRTVTYPRGHPRNPLSDSEVEEKFLSLARGVLKGRSREVLYRVWNVEDVADTGDLMKLFAEGGERGRKIS